jgi:formylglycine-generating enzyme required for sulfatase activity
MKKFFITCGLMASLLSACSQSVWGGGNSYVIATPVIPTITLQSSGVVVPETPTLTPTVTPAPTENLPTPTATIVTLPGPVMELDSTFLYADGSMLVAIPEGVFMMGGAGKDNFPHYVSLSSYWIYRTEVTKGQYDRCVQAGKCSMPDVNDDVYYGDPLWVNDPVVGVNYDQAAAYCKWVNASLPTEAQWEKAARGPDGDRYPWGDLPPTCDKLNFNFCVGQTTEVTKRMQGKSYYGVLDMSGNVFEWVSDWYNEDYFPNSPHENPNGPEEGEKRVVRSSSFKSGPDAAQTFIRSALLPQEHRDDVGFRCVVNDPTYYAPMCQQVPFYGVNANGESTVANPPNPKCADLSIELGLACKADGNPQTIVTFNGPPSSVFNAPNCVQDSQQNIFTCYTNETVSVCSDCTFTDLGQPTCAGDHYEVKDAACVWDGSAIPGAQCPDGFTYDTNIHCCTLSDPAAKFCPAGYYYLDKQQACVPYAAQSTYCVEKNVELRSCQ